MQNSNGPIIVVTHHLAVEAFSGLAAALETREQQETSVLTLTIADADSANKFPLRNPATSCEAVYRSSTPPHWTLQDLHHHYPDVPWGTVVAAERSFTDYSFLIDGTGYRRERDDYIVPLVLRFVAFFHDAYLRLQPKAVVTAFGDNIFTLIATVIAEENDIPVLLPQPAFLNEAGALEAGYFGNTRFLESFAMVRRYLELRNRRLSQAEQQRARAFAESLIAYDGSKTLTHIYKKKDFEKPVTPHRNRLFNYLGEQRQLDANIAFYKIDWKRKLAANIRRVFRQRAAARFLARASDDIPERTVFYPMHFQPEASTLVNGIWYANQIALIETLSKALPLGYTLIVKEHPRGRGMRPLWQYRHIASLHNVQFCDLPSKEILRKSDLVIAVSGSIGLEALAMDKPVVMLGRTFHTYNTLYFRAHAPEELPALLRNILLDNAFEKIPDRTEEIARFFLAYLEAMYDFFPMGERMADLAPLVIEELRHPQPPAKSWLAQLFNPPERQAESTVRTEEHL